MNGGLNNSLKRIALFGLLSLVYQGVNSHPYHESTTILEFNSQTRTLEFALRMLTEDVEKAICPSGRCPEQENELSRNEAIATYLKKHIRLQFADLESSEFHLLGTEINFREAWAYFEMKLPNEIEAADQFCLDYSIFTELNPEQINTVDYKSNNIRRTVSLTVKESRACFLLQEPITEK